MCAKSKGTHKILRYSNPLAHEPTASRPYGANYHDPHCHYRIYRDKEVADSSHAQTTRPRVMVTDLVESHSRCCAYSGQGVRMSGGRAEPGCRDSYARNSRRPSILGVWPSWENKGRSQRLNRRLVCFRLYCLCAPWLIFGAGRERCWRSVCSLTVDSGKDSEHALIRICPA